MPELTDNGNGLQGPDQANVLVYQHERQRSFNTEAVFGNVQQLPGVQVRIIKGLQEEGATAFRKDSVEVSADDCIAYFETARKNSHDYYGLLNEIPRAKKGEKPSNLEEIEEQKTRWADLWIKRLKSYGLTESATRIFQFIGIEPTGGDRITLKDLLYFNNQFGGNAEGMVEFLLKIKNIRQRETYKELEIDGETLTQTVEVLATAIHGKTRVGVYKQISLLEDIVWGDKENWEAAVKEIVEKGKALTEEEKELLSLVGEATQTESKDEKEGEPEGLKKRPPQEKVEGEETSAKPDIGIGSDKGKVREVNEDFVARPEDMRVSKEKIGEMGRLYVAADGMGGHAAGDWASKTAVEALYKSFYAKEDLERAVVDANKIIKLEATADPAKTGAGTTLTAALIKNGQLTIAHVGDSRAYLIKENDIVQITKDHTWVEERVDEGSLSKEEAVTHPRRNVITRAIGINDEVKVDSYTRAVEGGDYVILTTDGLTEYVRKPEIYNIISESKSSQEAANSLISLANERGGRDNISVVIVPV